MILQYIYTIYKAIPPPHHYTLYIYMPCHATVKLAKQTKLIFMINTIRKISLFHFHTTALDV
jgi:hypothetical protein